MQANAAVLERTPKITLDDLKVPKDIPRGNQRTPYTLKVGDKVHEQWLVKSIDHISDFDITAYKLEHITTDAQYIHLDCSDIDNVSAILFRTPPDDNTGKTHILEHLGTCGSKNYPIRDPFMQMLKRSLNTYMNAWTGSDFTMYPFSSQNAQDFRNLQSVYLDMAFFPLLNENDFRQEGHRLDINEETQEAMFKGVVYNEMKGAMSDPNATFMQSIKENLYKKSQYKYNSGGEPAFITDLKYNELLEFHDKYYHPSNCTFMSYGDLDFTEHLKFI